MDRGVLRRLGLVDTVVLDTAALVTGPTELTDLIPVAGADPAEVAEQAYALFDATAPERLAESDGWRLGPLEQLKPRGTTGRQAERKLRKRGADDVLGLARGHQLRAVVGISAQHSDGMRAIAAAARRSGARLVIAGDSQLGFADEMVPGGDELAASVRGLQEAGAVVRLLSGDRRALGAADCGIGVYPEGTAPAWGAHILVGQDLEAAALVIDAVAAAAAVDNNGIQLAAGGSGVGAVAALQAAGAAGRIPSAARRQRRDRGRVLEWPLACTPDHVPPAAAGSGVSQASQGARRRSSLRWAPAGGRPSPKSWRIR